MENMNDLRRCGHTSSCRCNSGFDPDKHISNRTTNYLPTRRESDAIKAILAQELEDQGAESNTSGLFIHEIEEIIADFYVELWYDIDYAEAHDLAERIAGSFDGIDV